MIVCLLSVSQGVYDFLLFSHTYSFQLFQAIDSVFQLISKFDVAGKKIAFHPQSMLNCAFSISTGTRDGLPCSSMFPWVDQLPCFSFSRSVMKGSSEAYTVKATQTVLCHV